MGVFSVDHSGKAKPNNAKAADEKGSHDSVHGERAAIESRSAHFHSPIFVAIDQVRGSPGHSG